MISLSVLKFSLPIPPTLNSCFRNVRINRRIPTEKAIAWKRLAQVHAKKCASAGWEISKEKTVIELVFYWKDKRRQDADNRLKWTLDSMNGILWEDDHVCLPRVMNYFIDSKNPRVELTVYRLKDELQRIESINKDRANRALFS